MSHCISAVIDQNEYSESAITEKFLDTFQLLSAKQKKIWQILQWYAVNYRNVFPSQKTIAEKAECCRDTVIQALKVFEKNGWIYSRWRCFRSKVYYLMDYLLKFDTKSNETFRRNPTANPTAIPTANPTLYSNTYSSSCNVRLTSQESESGTVHHTQDEKEQILSKMGITKPEDIWCLKRFKFHVLCKAYEDLTTRWYKAGPIQKLAAWITSRCKQYEPLYAGNPIIS